MVGGHHDLHPAPGQQMLKRDPDTAHGDRMQVKASAASAVQLTSTASEGAAEQHDLARVDTE